MSGKIILLIGPMFASKTTSLLTYARRYKLAKKTIVLIKYEKDQRYSVDEICSHDQQSLKATFMCNDLNEIMSYPEIKNANVILIDEAQFILNIVSGAEKLAND